MLLAKVLFDRKNSKDMKLFLPVRGFQERERICYMLLDRVCSINDLGEDEFFGACGRHGW
jgi:hypothetical protein